MAIVRVRLRGGPYDGVALSWDVPDADDPPMTYALKLHGPHEATEDVDYRRVGRAPDTATEWIYEAPRSAAG
ncbi:hypothetical protein [Micromonospora sp. NPDC093277]|uniref:hypothetical protein n=1 Tax=Micromonospora sp. NPDC093277 TaxID=3364291 RepID=UPI0037FC1040